MLSKLTRNVCAIMIGSCVVVSVCWAGGSGKEPGIQSPPVAVERQCKVVYVQHVDCELAAKHVRALFQYGDELPKVTWFAPAKAVLLRSTPAELEQMEFLLGQVDVAQPEVKTPDPPRSPGTSLRIYPLQYAKANQLAELVVRVIDSESSRSRRSSSSTPRLRVAIDERTNVVVLVASEAQLALAEEIIKALDVPLKALTTTEVPEQKPESGTKDNADG